MYHVELHCSIFIVDKICCNEPNVKHFFILSVPKMLKSDLQLFDIVLWNLHITHTTILCVGNILPLIFETEDVMTCFCLWFYVKMVHRNSICPFAVLTKRGRPFGWRNCCLFDRNAINVLFHLLLQTYHTLLIAILSLNCFMCICIDEIWHSSKDVCLALSIWEGVVFSWFLTDRVHISGPWWNPPSGSY